MMQTRPFEGGASLTPVDASHQDKAQEEEGEEHPLVPVAQETNKAKLKHETIQSSLQATKKQDSSVSKNGRARRLSWADMAPPKRNDYDSDEGSFVEENTQIQVSAASTHRSNSILFAGAGAGAGARRDSRPNQSLPERLSLDSATQSVTASVKGISSLGWDQSSSSASGTRSRITQRRRTGSSWGDSPGNSFRSTADTAGNRISLLTKQTIGCINGEDIDRAVLEERKSNAIWCLRTLTITTLTAAAVIVAVLTYTFSRNSELRVFQTQYEDSVVKVSEAINLAINNKLNTAMSFSAMYTSRFGQINSWPNVTMPHFEEQAEGQLSVAEGIALSFNPIITNITRTEWEAHATESAHIMGEPKLTNRSCDTCRIVSDGIFRKIDGKVTDDPGYSPESRYPNHMVPVWQIYPTAQNWRAVMFNLHSEINRQRALDDMLEYKVPTITGLLHLVQHVEMDPSSILFYPVFNQFHESRFFQEVVGSISIVFTWADILRSVLPNYIKGLIVVLEKSVADEVDSQSFTYSVSGEKVTLLGEGDMHDSQFDLFEHQVFANVAQEAEDLGIVDYLVTYRLRIYPSLTFQNQYLTMRPLVMTLSLIAMFLLTSGIFLLYDYLVHVRQNAVVKFAQRSGRIVDSLFPSGVRERLFSSAEHVGNQTMCDNKNTDPEGSGNTASAVISKRNPAHHIKHFLKGSFHKSHSESEKNEGYIQNSPPIADLFHNTTIMFADMVTFTEWSSKHSPEDVFYLLETLFLEFDKVANRMGVFKLGTIGDCYIAVTGVPDARKDHAVVLAEFAEECRNKTNQVISNLIEELGPSVGKLSMRIGLHSGSVTAGVLRGLKSRFELFGDTINTASRMESTGAPNMIQVSEETARILKQEGFESWLRPREDLVHAKGKGFLQTYWLEINKSDISSARQLSSPKKSEGTIDPKSSFVHQMYSGSLVVDNGNGEGNEDENISIDPEGKDAAISRCSSSSSIFADKSEGNKL